MNATDLDDRIREVVVTLARSASEPMLFADIRSRQLSPERSAERSRRRGLVAAGVALAVVAAITATALWLRPDSRHHTNPSDARFVIHEVVDYRQRAEITCPTGTPDVTGQFDRMTFETWGDEANGKFRMKVTYPDGTTRDVLAFGSPYYPTRLFTRGAIKGRQLGCNGSAQTQQYEPGQASVWSLTPLGAIPHTADGQTKVPQYDDRGTQVGGPHRDSRGRTANLWRHSTTGTESVGHGPAYGIVQVTEWFVAPRSRLVLEQRWHEHIDGIGDDWSTRTLARRESIPRDDHLFSDVGYDEVIIDHSHPTAPSTVSPPTTALPEP